jgi:CheY-like chemotaxis protein
MTERPPAKPQRPWRILVVDDNRDAAQMLQDLLEIHGHEVCIAYDGPTALGLAGEFAPDVALLDIGLPVMDGYEVATQLRRAVERPVRLIAVSGYGMQRDRARSDDAGFERHLVKPVSIEDLTEALSDDPEDRSGTQTTGGQDSKM